MSAETVVETRPAIMAVDSAIRCVIPAIAAAIVIKVIAALTSKKYKTNDIGTNIIRVSRA
jgi:hypothetical protein